MIRTCRLSVVAVGAVLLGTEVGRAQPPGPPPPARPVVSPYINLLRPTNSAGVNYYGLVRPQLAAQQQFGELRQQINTIQAVGVGTTATAFDLPATGVPVGFLNAGAYFLNHQVGRGPTPGRSGATVAPPRPTSRSR